MLGELRDEGILWQNPDTKGYQLAARVMRWAQVYSATSDLRKYAYPYMNAIFTETDETVSLYAAEEYSRVCVERIESRKNVRIVEMIGTRIQIFRGSGGKAILAFRSPEEIEAVLNYAAALPEDPESVDEINSLRQELEDIREKGFAISHGEWQTEASGIAAPIFNSNGIPIGSISISGPTQRFMDKIKLAHYADLLLQNVTKISQDLGYFNR